MMNQDWLTSWIQPHHLDPSALDRYRRAFVSHPARLIWLEHFLQPDVADRLSRFLTTEAEFAMEHGLYSVEGAVSAEAWHASDVEDRFFRLSKLTGTARNYQMSRNALTYIQFRQAFQRTEFRAFFEALSGLSLGWSDDFGSHAMKTGDFLRSHSDDDKNRQLALVIYLSPGWDASLGGVLHVIDKDETDTPIVPLFNSMVAFDVLADSQHFVTPVSDDADSRARLSIGGWYHKVTGPQ